jgi:hypothetical protein
MHMVERTLARARGEGVVGYVFELGAVVGTPAALNTLGWANVAPSELVGRHASGDWGDLCEHDRCENERSLQHGWRVMSSYPVGGGRVWVITEADRSVTTILLPEEY